MKRTRLLLIILMVFSGMTLFGQAEQNLSLDAEGVFQIPSENLSEVYTLDVSNLTFASLEEAVDFFAEKNTNLVFFRPNASLSEATVFLQLTKNPQWSASEWNSAIASISLKNQ